MLNNMDTYLKEQRAKERKCARTLKGKALLVIDHILTNLGSDDELLSRLYGIAHCATGVCGNQHESWQKEVHELYEKLKG